MSSTFGRNFRIVAAVHVGLALGLAVVSGARSCWRGKPEVILPVDFVVEVDAAPQEMRDPVPEPVPEPVQEPEPEPQPVPKPEPEPQPVPKPEPEPPRPAPKPERPPKRRPVQTSHERVTRTVGGEARKSPLTQEQIRKMLADGARPGDTTTDPDDMSRCFAIVRRTLYSAWLQPTSEEAGTAKAEVSLTLSGDGRVASWAWAVKSGNAVLDASVAAAADSVKLIQGLSADFLRKHRVITVAFKVE